MDKEDMAPRYPFSFSSFFIKESVSIVYEFFDPYDDGMLRVICEEPDPDGIYERSYCYQIWFDRNDPSTEPDDHGCGLPDPLIALHNALDVLRERILNVDCQ